MSNNPFATPQQPGPLGHLPAPAEILSKVSGPAIGLMVVGGLNVLLSIFGLVSSLLNILGANPLTNMQMDDMNRNRQQMAPDAAEMVDQFMWYSELMSGPVGLVTNTIGLLVGIAIIVAGMKMKSLQSYPFVMTLTIMAMIPCVSGCCWAGLPIGIWAIVVLSDPNVKAAFSTR